MSFVMLDVNDYKLVIIAGSKEEDGRVRFFGEASEYRFHLEALKRLFYILIINL